MNAESRKLPEARLLADYEPTPGAYGHVRAEPGYSTKRLLTPEEAGERLNCGRTTVYALVASGKLASVRIGRLRRIPVAVVDQYIDRLLEGELDQRTPRKARRPTRADDHASGRDPATEKLLEELGVGEVRT